MDTPQWVGGVFSVSVPTQSGRTYTLEFQNVAGNGTRSGLPLVPGSGFSQTLLDTNATDSERFYRVRRW